MIVRGLIFLKTAVKKSIFTAMGLSFAVIVIGLGMFQNSKEAGPLYVVFAAALFLLNLLLFLPSSKIKWRSAKVISITLIFILNFALAAGVSVYILQDSMLFYPNNSVACFKKLEKEKSFETVGFTTKDGVKLSGWIHRSQKSGRAPLLLYFGGNGQNSSKAFYDFLNQNTFSKLDDYGILMIDYRGYGYSGGKTDDTLMFSDALSIYDYAVSQSYTDPAHVVCMGYSMGTGPATYLASQRRIGGLILVAPYYDGKALYNGMMDIFHGPLTVLIRHPLDTERYAPQVKCRPLILTSKADETISCRQSEALSKRFPRIDKLVYIEGVNHNTYFKSDKMLNEIQGYLSKAEEGTE